MVVPAFEQLVLKLHYFFSPSPFPSQASCRGNWTTVISDLQRRKLRPRLVSWLAFVQFRSSLLSEELFLEHPFSTLRESTNCIQVLRGMNGWVVTPAVICLSAWEHNSDRRHTQGPTAVAGRPMRRSKWTILVLGRGNTSGITPHACPSYCDP